MSMPKAPVNKNRDICIPAEKIWTTGKGRYVRTKLNPKLSQQAFALLFGTCPFGLHRPHDSAAMQFGEYVGHVS